MVAIQTLPTSFRNILIPVRRTPSTVLHLSSKLQSTDYQQKNQQYHAHWPLHRGYDHFHRYYQSEEHQLCPLRLRQTLVLSSSATSSICKEKCPLRQQNQMTMYINLAGLSAIPMHYPAVISPLHFPLDLLNYYRLQDIF